MRTDIANPFIDMTSPLDSVEIAKLVFLTPLAILRLLMAICIGLSAYLPAPPYTQLIYGLLLCFGYYDIEVHGHNNVNATRGQAVIMASNHISFIDTFVLSYLLRPIWVARTSQSTIPFFGKYLRSIGSVFVPSPAEGAGTGASKLIEDAARRRPNGRMVCIFPEGGCSNGQQLLKFKSGAFVPLLPILPCIITHRSPTILPSWTLDNVLFVIWRLLTQLENRVAVRFLPIVYPYEGENVGDFKERVRGIMSAASGLPLSNHGIEDFRELTKGLALSWDRRRVVEKV